MGKINATTETFLKAFYGDAISKDSRFVIFTGHNKGHQWCHSIEYGLERIDPSKDTYLSMCTFPRGVTSRLQESARCMFGVWLDIDCGKENGSYFKTPEDAYEWASDALAGYWTWINHSGRGLHVYLMFDEPFWIESDEDRLRARHIIRAYWSWANKMCPNTIDTLTDLARVMRLPGTLNTKSRTVCHTVDESGITVAFSDLEEFLPEVELTEDASVDVNMEGEVDVDALKQSIQNLRDSDQNFDRTWKRQRRLQDQSPSGYCMSIANQLVSAGFSNAEIATAVRNWRAGQTDAGVKPESWYTMLVSKARAEMQGDVVGKQLVAALEEDDQKTHLEGVSAVLCKEVKKVKKIVTPEFRGQKEKCSYTIYFTDGGTVNIPDTVTLMSQHKMKALAFEEGGVLMKNLKASKWDAFLNLLLSIMEIEEAPIEGNMAYLVNNEILKMAAKKQEGGYVVDDIEALTDNSLYEDDGVLYFGLDTLMRHLASRGYNLGSKRVAGILKSSGADSRQFGSGKSGNRRRLWTIPEGECDEDNEATE